MNNRLHIALNVRDLETSTAFYEAVFALAPDKVRDGYARFTLDDPPLVLALNAKDEVRDGNRVGHLGVRLGADGDLSVMRSRLAARDLIHKEQTRTKCCHSVQNKLWVVDPDGNYWEFYELVADHVS